MEPAKKNIKAYTLPELEQELTRLGLKKYRAGQVFDWIYRHHAAGFEDMTNLAKADRELLAEHFSVAALQLLKTEESQDGTKKFLFRLQDGHSIESVLIPDEDRNTLCISSQVGCAQGCRFCLTGSGGFQRNLEAYEIADQVLFVDGILGDVPAPGPDREGRMPRITNIVLWAWVNRWRTWTMCFGRSR